MKTIEEIIHEDLEALSGKYISGDITPVVFEILHKTEHKERLLRYLGHKVKSVNRTCEKPATFQDLFGNCPVVKGRRRR